MIDVLTAGAINTDLVARLVRAPEAGETTTGTEFAIFGGGKGANQALAAVRAGASTAILGALGEDTFGRDRLADLKADNVITDAIVIRSDAPSGVALITVETSSGQNRIAYVPGATLTITPHEASHAVASQASRVFLTTLELPTESIAAAIEGAKAAGAIVILNATPEPELAHHHLARIDTLIVNEPEAGLLLGNPAITVWEQAAADLQALGPTNVIITLGSAGAIARFGADVVRIAAPPVTVVDTTGAGDALCGAFAAAIATGKPLEDSLRFGIAAGSLACTIAGAQRSMPTVDAIHNLMK